MFRHLVIITALTSVFSLSTSLSAQAIDPTTPVHDPESEPDYGPGFWDSEVDTTEEDRQGGEINSELPDPTSIDEFTNLLIRPFLTFKQTYWNECSDSPTGNYDVYNCAKSRQVAVIFDNFLKNRLMTCVDEGLQAMGGGRAQDFHIVHAGVTADARHSPYSLHSHNRAIDVKVIRVLLTTGATKQFTYSKTGNRPFYKNLRKCWGEQVNVYNGCPYYGGDKALTGSIGWENRDHGRHMHLSVPYCLSGRYGSGVWQR